MQLSESEKRKILESQLTEGTRGLDEPISENELLVVLNKKNQGKPFNDDLFEQLTLQVQKSRANLTIRNFVEIFPIMCPLFRLLPLLLFSCRRFASAG